MEIEQVRRKYRGGKVTSRSGYKFVPGWFNRMKFKGNGAEVVINHKAPKSPEELEEVLALMLGVPLIGSPILKEIRRWLEVISPGQ